jgi:hypothetical protein
VEATIGPGHDEAIIEAAVTVCRRSCAVCQGRVDPFVDMTVVAVERRFEATIACGVSVAHIPRRSRNDARSHRTLRS